MSNLQEDAAKGLIGLESPQEGELEAVFVFPSGLALFEGHFPGRPIVPGVLEVETARAALEKHFKGTPLRIQSIEKAKFTREVKPGEEIRLRMSFAPSGEKDTWSVKGTLSVNGEKAGQVTLTLAKEA